MNVCCIIKLTLTAQWMLWHTFISFWDNDKDNNSSIHIFQGHPSFKKDPSMSIWLMSDEFNIVHLMVTSVDMACNIGIWLKITTAFSCFNSHFFNDFLSATAYKIVGVMGGLWAYGRKGSRLGCGQCWVFQQQGSKLRPIQLHVRLNLFPFRLKYREKVQICDLFSPLLFFETKGLPVANLLLL